MKGRLPTTVGCSAPSIVGGLAAVWMSRLTINAPSRVAGCISDACLILAISNVATRLRIGCLRINSLAAQEFPGKMARGSQNVARFFARFAIDI